VSVSEAAGISAAEGGSEAASGASTGVAVEAGEQPASARLAITAVKSKMYTFLRLDIVFALMNRTNWIMTNR
jgi:hypothetical protein